jgi:uncharacterized membrane protein YedE/YeeE
MRCSGYAPARSTGKSEFNLDAPLILGAAVFGIGWGLSGFCPAGLVPVLGIGRTEPLLFLGGLVAGLIATRILRARIGSPETRARLNTVEDMI